MSVVACLEEYQEALLRSELTTDLSANIARFEKLLNKGLNSDAQFRTLMFFGRQILILYIEGMADDKKISDFALRACAERAEAPGTAIDAQYLMQSVLEIAQCELENRVSKIVEAVVTGMTAVLIDGCGDAVLMETRGYPVRQVNRTTNESVVIGA